jgi:hypothetical protein
VYWSEALGHWVLTRYDDVLAATRNAALSSARTEVFVRAQLAGSEGTFQHTAFKVRLLAGHGRPTRADCRCRVTAVLLRESASLRPDPGKLLVGVIDFMPPAVLRFPTGPIPGRHPALQRAAIHAAWLLP